MLGQKSNTKKFTKMKIVSSIFSNYNGMKLEIINRKKPVKFTNIGI